LNNITFIFFRFFNFFVVVSIIAYFVKRYLRASILKQIHNRQNYFKSLELDYTRLNQDYENIEKELKEKEMLAKDLKIKLDKWRQVFILEQETKKKENEAIKINIEKNNLIKQKNITLEYLASKTLVKGISNAKSTINKEFNEIEACKYQDSLIEFIKKESL